MTSLKKAGDGGDQNRWEDTTEERYLAMREVVMSNTIMSVGLCVFHTRGSSGHGAPRGPETLVARPYNFLIFPDPASTPNLALDMQTLVDFHVDECNFDFNKWIYSGIPYTDAAGEAELHSTMRAQHGLTAHTHHQMTRSVRERPRVPLTTEGDLRFLRTALEGLDLWLRHQGVPPGNPSVSSNARVYGAFAICGLLVCQQSSARTAPHLPPRTARTYASYTGPQRKAPEYQLPPCNSFLRLALHQALAAQYPNLRIMIRPREWKPRGGGSGCSWWGRLCGKKAAGEQTDGARVESRRSWGTSDRVLFVAREDDARCAARNRAIRGCNDACTDPRR